MLSSILWPIFHNPSGTRPPCHHLQAPLYLGFDLRNTTTLEAVWPIIGNQEAIAVNQQYAGHPGMLVKSWTPATPAITEYFVATGSLGHTGAQEDCQIGWAYTAATRSVATPTPSAASGPHCLAFLTSEERERVGWVGDVDDDSALVARPCNVSDPAQEWNSLNSPGSQKRFLQAAAAPSEHNSVYVDQWYSGARVRLAGKGVRSHPAPDPPEKKREKKRHPSALRPRRLLRSDLALIRGVLPAVRPCRELLIGALVLAFPSPMMALGTGMHFSTNSAGHTLTDGLTLPNDEAAQGCHGGVPAEQPPVKHLHECEHHFGRSRAVHNGDRGGPRHLGSRRPGHDHRCAITRRSAAGFSLLAADATVTSLSGEPPPQVSQDTLLQLRPPFLTQ